MTEEQNHLKKACEGEAESIAWLYQTHKEKLYKFIYFRVGSQADSEDLFQEIMLAAFDSLPRFRGEVPFLHWCYQIARNKIAYFWRQKAQKPTMELDENAAYKQEEEPADELIEEMDLTREKVLQILEQLPENYAQVLKLRFFEGKTLVQAAEIMKVTLANVKVLQHRALKKAAQLYAASS